MKQLKFDFAKKNALEFGGSLLKGNARSKRPLDSKKPIHLVLRRAANQPSMRSPKNYLLVDIVIKEAAKEYGVTVYSFANVGNHLHLALRISSRRLWSRFIREITGRIAQHIGQTKGFWMHKPFTRVVSGWGKAYTIVRKYIHLNNLEAEGKIDRRKIETFSDLRQVQAYRTEEAQSTPSTDCS